MLRQATPFWTISVSSAFSFNQIKHPASGKFRMRGDVFCMDQASVLRPDFQLSATPLPEADETKPSSDAVRSDNTS